MNGSFQCAVVVENWGEFVELPPSSFEFPPESHLV